MPALKLNRFDFIEYVRTHGNSEMSVGALLGIFDHITEIEEKTGQTYFVEPDEIFATYEEITLDEWNSQHTDNQFPDGRGLREYLEKVGKWVRVIDDNHILIHQF